MKKCLFILLSLTSSLISFAQIKIFINGSEITPGSVTTLASIETVEVSFLPTFKADTYTNGYGYFSIQHFNTLNQSISVEYPIFFEGASACENWMKSQKKFLIYNKLTKKSDFSLDGSIYQTWENAKYNLKSNLLGVKVIAGYRDKIGYDKYGSHVDLAPEFLFLINPVTDPSKLLTPLSTAFFDYQKAKEINFEKSYPSFYELKVDDVFKGNANFFTAFKGENTSSYNMRGVVISPSISSDEQIELIKTNLIKEVIYNTQKRRAGNVYLEQTIVGKFKGQVENESQTKQWDYFSYNTILSSKALKSKKQIVESEFYEDITLGQLKGIRLLFAYDNSDERSFNSFYLFKDPKNPNNVLIFSGTHNKNTTQQSFNEQVIYMESILSALQF